MGLGFRGYLSTCQANLSSVFLCGNTAGGGQFDYGCSNVGVLGTFIVESFSSQSHFACNSATPGNNCQAILPAPTGTVQCFPTLTVNSSCNGVMVTSPADLVPAGLNGFTQVVGNVWNVSGVIVVQGN